MDNLFSWVVVFAASLYGMCRFFGAVLEAEEQRRRENEEDERSFGLRWVE